VPGGTINRFQEGNDGGEKINDQINTLCDHTPYGLLMQQSTI